MGPLEVNIEVQRNLDAHGTVTWQLVLLQMRHGTRNKKDRGQKQ